jgi:hypothetical protein
MLLARPRSIWKDNINIVRKIRCAFLEKGSMFLKLVEMFLETVNTGAATDPPPPQMYSALI